MKTLEAKVVVHPSWVHRSRLSELVQAADQLDRILVHEFDKKNNGRLILKKKSDILDSYQRLKNILKPKRNR